MGSVCQAQGIEDRRSVQGLFRGNAQGPVNRRFPGESADQWPSQDFEQIKIFEDLKIMADGFSKPKTTTYCV
jgi:hypothetical protein